MKTALVYLCEPGERGDYFISSLPVGLASIAAYLESRGRDVALLNYSALGYRRALEHLLKLRPGLVGVSLYTHNRAESLRFIRALRKRLPRAVIVAGGPHAGLLAEPLLKKAREIDYIIRGEGETALDMIIGSLEKNSRPAGPVIDTPPIADLDSLPFPGAYGGPAYGMDPNEQFKVIITSRGCPYSCAFCCSPSLWGRRVRFRSAENIADEMAYLRKKYGILYFSIRDDNLTLKKSRVMRLCRVLIERRLFVMWNCQSRVDTVDEEMLAEIKRAGCEQVQFGVETGSPRVLSLYDKKAGVEDIKNASRMARRVGLYLFFYLMAGMEGETESDIKKTVSLIRQALPGDGVVSPVALYPGSGIFESLKSKGALDDRIWFENRDSGVFLRRDPAVGEWVARLVNELGMIREWSWYRAKDFAQHRAVTGADCWVTDILEGDYYLDGENHGGAERCYERVTGNFPDNPWGHLRMGKSRFYAADYPSAVEHYRRVTELVPSYYGGRLKLAESLLGVGDREGALKNAAEALRLNPHDRRIRNLLGLIKK